MDCACSCCCSCCCCCCSPAAPVVDAPDGTGSIGGSTSMGGSGSSAAPRFARRRSAAVTRCSKRPSVARRAVASPQIFSARTSELAVMICMSRSTSLSCPMTAALPTFCVRPFCDPIAAPCPRTSAARPSNCLLRSPWTSPQPASTSPRSSARAAATSPRRLAVAASTRDPSSPRSSVLRLPTWELSSLRSSAPRLRMRAKSSAASRTSAADWSERRAPAASAARLLAASPNSLRCAPPASSSSTARSEAKALESSCEFSIGASPATTVFTLRASSATAARSFSTSARRNLRSALSSSLRSQWLCWCRSSSLLRASRSVSRAPTKLPSLMSSSLMEFCKNSVVVRSIMRVSVTANWCRRSSTSVLRVVHSASR
mmetsp:Transcript_26114/g.82874  ORF Transcript_26114/g.82874 Transcript_26114/m.82874 type:complete len:373 (-) Transcript_26114:1470-2588(-)